MKTLIFVVAVIILGLVTFSGVISKSVDEAPFFKSFFGDDTPTTSTTPVKQIEPNQTENPDSTSTKTNTENFNPGAFRGPTSPPHVNGPSAPPPAY
jgi:hypothetical protein